MLQPPTDEALQARAKRLVLEGEKAYGAGDLKQALRTLNLAINIQPHNERALSDLSWWRCAMAISACRCRPGRR